MKKSLLHAVLMTTLCVMVYAQSTNAANDSITPSPEQSGTSSTPQNVKTTLSAPMVSPALQTPTEQSTSSPSASTPLKTIDCNYHIPTGTLTVEQTLIKQWAEKAATQSFSFDFNALDNELAALKACFTDQGWQSFNDALQKSGNLFAIKSQQLTVSSMATGDITVNPIKENQWKVILALQVVYQNDKEKLTQPLIVNLIVGRKPSGDLGIMQMIATPQQLNTQSTNEDTSAPTTTSTTATPTATTTTTTTSTTTTPAATTPMVAPASTTQKPSTPVGTGLQPTTPATTPPPAIKPNQP